MAQMTWRADPDLIERVRRRARESGRSMNEWVTSVLDAATNPEHTGDETERVREKLRAAGLLVTPGPARPRPDPARVAEARRQAGKGTPLSDIVSEQRG